MSETVTIKIPKETYEFLKELGRTIQLQDNRGGNSPVGFIIRQKERQYHIEEGEADGFEWYDKENCESVTIDNLMDDESLVESFVELGLEEDDEKFNREDGDMVHAFEEWIHDNHNDQYERCYYVEEYKPVIGEVFLTERAAYDHLKSNRHNYRGEPQVYGFTFFDRCWDEIRQLCFFLCGFDPQPYNPDKPEREGANHAYGPYRNKFPKIEVINE